MENLAGRPYWHLSFTEDGTLGGSDRAGFLADLVTTEVRDLFVISHGWGTSRDSADELYESLLPMIVELAAKHAPELERIGLVGVHWPSLWFPDQPATVPAGDGGDAQSSDPAAQAARSSGDAQFTGREIALALRQSFADPASRAGIDRLGAIIDEGIAATVTGTEPEQAQRQRLAEFHDLLKALLPPPMSQAPFEDSGEESLLFSTTPERDYAIICGKFGGASAPGAAQGLGDIFRNIWNGAKDVLRVGSYYVMKARAGQVGKAGLGPLLADVHAASAGIRVHLIGHSFGGRLVSFALAGIPTAADSPVASLTLVQAAFSHFSFSHAQDNPFDEPGALHTVADRVHGPLVATFSQHDWAVGRWYPAASALARQDNQANPQVSRWGALGADGFQAVKPLAARELQSPGSDYGFAAANFYTVDGTAVIDDWRQSAFAGAHSDIRKPEVAWLTVAAAAS